MKLPILLAAAIVGLSLQPTVAADFPEPKPIAPSEDSADYWPAFSQDGEHVIFSRRQGEGPWRLFTAAVGGGAAHLLFDPPPSAVATRLSRSPRGRLAFAGAGTIWVTDARGENPTRLTLKGLTGNPSYPCWYPDEKHLLVVAYRGDEGGVLYRIDVSSGDATAVTRPEDLRCGMPSVSPDGKSILFAGQRNEGQTYDQTRNRIWLISGDEPAKPLSPHQGRAATWSPDGKWIAYESTEGSPDGRRHAIFLILPSGENDHRVTSYEWDPNHPVWSPDGRLLAMSILDPENPKRTRIATLANPEGF